jgi:hypothetical protein
VLSVAAAALIVGSTVVGVVVASNRSAVAPPTPSAETSATLHIRYETPDGTPHDIAVTVGGAQCSYTGKSVLIRAASADDADAFSAAGKDEALAALVVTSGDVAFVSTDFPTVADGRVHLADSPGQINRWNGGEPGDIVAAHATISGTVTCASVERD